MIDDLGSSSIFFFSSRRRHTRCGRDWSSDVCSSDLCAWLGPLISWLVTVLHSITESPPSRNTSGITASAHIRTRGGCSYDPREDLFFCRSTASVRNAGARSLPVIGAFYGVHCSKSPAGRVQSGFQSPSPRGRKLMSERGVLLVNLGSPASTEVADVRRYLNQFLMDPCVVDLPWLPRRLLVSLILLRRPKASAEAYASIWWEEGSPLVVISQRVRDQLRSRLDMPVELAMRYGEPSIEQGILALVQQGVSEILLMHQYPQFADSTITTVVREARRVIDQHGLKVRLTELPAFHDRPDYLEALAESARPHLEGGFDHLLFSYHGLPERHLRKADPTGGHCLSPPDCCERPSPAHARCYRAQCKSVSREIARRFNLKDDQWSVAFQSRLGRAKWIAPYTEVELERLAARGVKRLLVMCPAFTADCIETLEEIGDRGREQFINAGGEELVLIPCLNDHPQWMDVLADWARREPVSA